jgi:copper chaperone CopZ
MSVARRATYLLAFVLGVSFGGGRTTQAQVLSAKVSVRGMTCNICSGTVERRLRRLSFVERATVDLEAGLAQLAVRSGPRFDGRRVLRSIHDAGFTPGDIQVVARGRLLIREETPYLELAPGQVALLLGPHGGMPPVSFRSAGSVLRVTGRFADPSGDTRASVAITVERAELASAF